jgi:hypothetical protein
MSPGTAKKETKMARTGLLQAVCTVAMLAATPAFAQGTSVGSTDTSGTAHSATQQATPQSGSMAPANGGANSTSMAPADKMGSAKSTDSSTKMGSGKSMDSSTKMGSEKPMDGSTKMGSGKSTDGSTKMGSGKSMDSSTKMGSEKPVDHSTKMGSAKSKSGESAMAESHATHHSAMAHPTGAMHSAKSDSSQDASIDRLNDQSYQAAEKGQAFASRGTDTGSAGTAKPGSGHMNDMSGGSMSGSSKSGTKQ